MVDSEQQEQVQVHKNQTRERYVHILRTRYLIREKMEKSSREASLAGTNSANAASTENSPKHTP